MSEYQYYEFQAIDRMLTEADRTALRGISGRARITARSFTNHYEWGDFKGDPAMLVERWFDLHLYLANWGTRRLMIRWPERAVADLDPGAFVPEADFTSIWTADRNLILDICRDDVEPAYDDWDDGSGWLTALTPLRSDVLSGDLRLFYLLWLMAVEDDLVCDEAAEPLPGVGKLSAPLEAFAEYFDIDADLVQAAAERSCDSGISPEAIRTTLAMFPESRKTSLLQRVIEGDPHVVAELRKTCREQSPSISVPFRTAGDLRARARELQEARERAAAERRAAEDRRIREAVEKARRMRLEGIKRQGPSVWRVIEEEIQRRNPSGYDRATSLLEDLRVLAGQEGTLDDFERNLAEIRERHAPKKRLIERLSRFEGR